MTRKYRIVKTPVGYHMRNKKFRIIQIPSGFKIQYKWLGLIWTDFSEPDYTYSSYLSGYTRDCETTTWIRQSSVEAKRALDFARQFPMEYRGHQIDYGRRGERVIYVDLSSSRYTGRGYRYTRASNNLDRLKEDIDKSIEEEYREKHKNDRLAVYENL